jgi:hypothetical protein
MKGNVIGTFQSSRRKDRPLRKVGRQRAPQRVRKEFRSTFSTIVRYAGRLLCRS